MNANNNEKLEKIFNQALELYEKGKSISEILNLFPQYRDELEEMFQIIQVIIREKEKISPSKELLTKIISQIQPTEKITKIEESRYFYRGAIKGRPSMFVESIINLFANMEKKIYIGLAIGILVLLVAGGIYWQSQKITVSPIESEVSFEEQALEQDIAGLEEFEQDKSLENLEQDLGTITEEEVVSLPTGKKTDISSIENLESELNSELASLANDLSDLESGFINDTSLDNLDSGLAGVAE